jgi:hypothetical protein
MILLIGKVPLRDSNNGTPAVFGALSMPPIWADSGADQIASIASPWGQRPGFFAPLRGRKTNAHGQYRSFIFRENQWLVLKAEREAPAKAAWPEDRLEFAKKKALDTAARTDNLKMSFGFLKHFLLNGGRFDRSGTLAEIAAVIVALTGLLAELRKWRR